LTAPANDAEAIAKLLEEYGDFKVKRLPEVQKPGETISVGKLTRVSRSQLKKALEDLFNPGSGYPSTAVLYFAGHGLREGGSAPSGYLATSEANLNQEIYGISLKWLRDLLQVSPVKQQVIWLDCCYSGELLNFDDADPGYRGQGKDRCFIAASRAFELAYEQVGHGALTEFLLKGLDPREYSGKWITNYSLVNFLDTQLQGTPQHPIFANSGESIKLTHKLTQLTQWKSTEPDLIPPVAAPCPYKGLQHFDCNDEDAKYFFGRTDLTDQLLNHIRQHNFLAVTGASGSGKSSLVRAGLLYQLKLGVRLSGSNQWDTRIFNPGENPLENLAKAFVEPNLPMIDRAKQFVNAKDLISIGANGLAQIVQAANDRMVLVVDQFEEVFTQCQNNIERQQFFECLLGALERSTNKLCLILVMRSDFFGKCTEKDYAGLARKIQSHLVTVTPMNEQELRQVITEPAKQVGLRVEPELVQQMIADVKDSPGRLPLLEYTLARLWERCGGRQLLLTTYIDLGSVMGTLQKRADKVYEGLSGDEEKLGDEKQIAKQIFLELVQVGDGTEHTRKRVHKQDLITSPQHETIVDQVIQKLTKENLLVTSGWSVRSGESDKVSMVELAHEALIRYWPKLLKWIEKNQDELRKRQMLEEMTDEWRKNGKKVEIEYLLQGKKLNDAEQFIRSHSEKIPLSSLAQEFVKVSQQERDRLSWEKSKSPLPYGDWRSRCPS
jgi:energy-coupling factor transporter ATP-binding protein EcfA2